MKKSKLYLKVIIVLAFVLVLILLFPPYTIEKEDIKFFDFVFNSEKVIKQLDETYSYSFNSKDRNVTETDTINAIDLKVTAYTDTIFKYIELKKLPEDKKYSHVGDFFIRYTDEKLYQMYTEYIQKEIDYISNYTITNITKHYYAEGYRKVLVTQLIIEILIAIILSVLITAVLIFRNSKKDLQ